MKIWASVHFYRSPVDCSIFLIKQSLTSCQNLNSCSTFFGYFVSQKYISGIFCHLVQKRQRERIGSTWCLYGGTLQVGKAVYSITHEFSEKCQKKPWPFPRCDHIGHIDACEFWHRFVVKYSLNTNGNLQLLFLVRKSHPLLLLWCVSKKSSVLKYIAFPCTHVYTRTYTYTHVYTRMGGHVRCVGPAAGDSCVLCFIWHGDALSSSSTHLHLFLFSFFSLFLSLKPGRQLRCRASFAMGMPFP